MSARTRISRICPILIQRRALYSTQLGPINDSLSEYEVLLANNIQNQRINLHPLIMSSYSSELLEHNIDLLSTIKKGSRLGLNKVKYELLNLRFLRSLVDSNPLLEQSLTLSNYYGNCAGARQSLQICETLSQESLTRANEALLHYSNIKVVAARLRSPG